MTSCSTRLVKGTVYPANALMSPIFISIFGNKTVMLSSINNLSRLFFFYIKQPSQYTAESSSWIQLLQDGASLKKVLLIHYSHFKLCNISEQI